VGGSIGTAVLAVVLSHQIAKIVPGAAAGETGMQTMRNLSPAMYSEALPALGRAFGHTFMWSLAVIALGLIAASFLPRQKVTAGTEAVHAPAAAE
jgi:hypothetical protein